MGMGGMNVFDVETQVEDSSELNAWEDMRTFLAEQERGIMNFKSAIVQLASYGLRVPSAYLDAAVNEAWEHISPEMGSIVIESGINSVEEMRAFVRGYMMALKKF